MAEQKSRFHEDLGGTGVWWVLEMGGVENCSNRNTYFCYYSEHAFYTGSATLSYPYNVGGKILPHPPLAASG
jgi:hypothetical protein